MTLQCHADLVQVSRMLGQVWSLECVLSISHWTVIVSRARLATRVSGQPGELRVQDAIERTDHSRLRSAARKRWENVISAQSKGEQSPAAAKFRMGPCLPSKCSERKSVTSYDTDAARVRAA